jgi:sensor histidine kinase YesM
MENILRDSQLDSQSITVLTYNDQVMSCTDPGLFATGDVLAPDVSLNDGSVTSVNVQGAKYAVSSTSFESGWKVILMVPGQNILQALKSLAPMVLGFIALLFLIALCMSLLFARRLVRPIVTLSRVMLCTRSTQTLPSKTSVPRSGDEIESLYLSYNAMVEKNTDLQPDQGEERNAPRDRAQGAPGAD